MRSKPFLFVFVGLDGSGKSTQAIALRDRLAQSGYEAAYCWSRRVAFLTAIPSFIVKRLLLKEPDKSDGSDYAAIKEGRRSSLFSRKWLRFLWIRLSLLDYVAAFHFKVRWPNRKYEVLICDRYLHDAVVDLAVASGTPVREIWESFVCRIFPVPVRTYFIEISAEIGHSRKNDGTSLEYLLDRTPVYAELARVTQTTCLDGNMPITELQRLIQEDAIAVVASRDKVRAAVAGEVAR